MASSAFQNNTPNCSICLEGYKEPRKLPGCSHSFCEACIVRYVNKLKAEDELNQNFKCPVCRLPTEIPENQDISLDWVKQMDKDNELDSNLKGRKQDGSTEYCYPCKQLNKAVISEYYCLNCEIFLCKSCSEILHVCKLYKNHTVLDCTSGISESFCEPSLTLMSQLLTCANHPNNTFEFFCEDHEQVVCCTCVAKHRGCKVLNEVRNLSKCTLKFKVAKLKEASEKQAEYIKQTIDIYKRNEEANKARAETIRTEIQNLRQKLIKIVETLEENLNQDCSAMAKNINIHYLDEIEELKCMLGKIEVAQNLIRTHFSTATEDQMFVSIEGINKMYQENERKFLEKNFVGKSKELKLKTEDLINAFLKLGLNQMSKLASIIENESDIAVPRYSKRNFEIEKLHSSSIIAKESNEGPTYNDMLYLQDNQLLLVDSYYGYCCLVDDRYKEIASRAVVTEDPTRIDNFKKQQYAAVVAKDLIAISMFQDKKISLVSASDLSTKRELICKYSPKSMVGLDDNFLAISWENPLAFGIIEIQDSTYSDKVYFTEDRVGRKFQSFDYMSVDKGRKHVFQPCNVEKAVYCFSFDGDPIFAYKAETLKEPRGVAVDSSGNIYVCDEGSAGVHIISPIGEALKLFKEGCPNKQLAISFNTNGDMFGLSREESPWDEISFFSLREH